MNWFWRIVFWWKRRTGWLDLGKDIFVSGTVINLTPPDIDGDRNFDVRLDSVYDWYITGFGGRRTRDPGASEASMHCEIPPWADVSLKSTYDGLKVGDRVTVRGRWGFDGVHLGRSMWIEVLAALVRHMPNVNDGWFEIHPVIELVKI